MRELTKDGLTLRWPETPGHPGEKVLIEAGPAAAGQAMNVFYSVDGGPERLCRAWPVGRDPESGLQTFAARLPQVPPGSTIDWRPVLSSGTRELGPEKAAPRQPKVAAPAGVDLPSTQQPFPYRMEHLARVTVPLEQTPTKVGETPEGLMIVFPLASGGTVKGPRLNGTIEHVGGDWMHIRPDGIGLCDARIVVDCADGSKLLAEYSGVVDFGRDGYQSMSTGSGPKMVDVQLTPRFISASPEYEWLNRLQCLGLGRVTMAKLLVEYDLYAVRSLAISEIGGKNA